MDFSRRYADFKKATIKGIEQELQRQADELGKTTSCRQGCTHCCKLFVAATLQECETIVYYLYGHPEAMRRFIDAFLRWQGRLETIGEHVDVINRLYGQNMLGRASEAEQLALHAAMEHYQLQDIDCPFLDGGACSIYEVRPYVCAGVVSVSPAAWCSPSHENHRDMSYLKAAVDMRQDMPYFVPPRSGLLFASMPWLVYDILRRGYDALSDIPGLEALRGQT